MTRFPRTARTSLMKKATPKLKRTNVATAQRGKSNALGFHPRKVKLFNSMG